MAADIIPFRPRVTEREAMEDIAAALTYAIETIDENPIREPVLAGLLGSLRIAMEEMQLLLGQQGGV